MTGWQIKSIVNSMLLIRVGDVIDANVADERAGNIAQAILLELEAEKEEVTKLGECGVCHEVDALVADPFGGQPICRGCRKSNEEVAQLNYIADGSHG